MKTKITLTIVSLSALALMACKNDVTETEPEIIVSTEDANWVYLQKPESVRSPYFIRNYAEPIYSGIECDYALPFFNGDSQGMPIDLNQPQNVNKIGFYLRDYKKKIEAGSDPVYVGAFIELSNKNKDKSYNDYFWDRSYYLDRPANFTLICDRAYDAQHPAGRSLNDIVEISYYTAKPFLDSRYKNKRLGDYLRNITSESLNDFNAKNVELVRGNMIFKLSKAPSEAGSYRFTIRVAARGLEDTSVVSESVNLSPIAS